VISRSIPNAIIPLVIKIDVQRRHEIYVKSTCGKKPRTPTDNDHYRGIRYKRRGHIRLSAPPHAA
jgi:hypothetical protein